MPYQFTFNTTHLACYLTAAMLVTACDPRGTPENAYQVAIQGLHSADISPSAEHIAVGSIYHGGSYWKHHEQARLYNWNHAEGEQSTLTNIDISDNNRWTLTAETHTMVLWDNQSGQGLRYWTAPGEILDADLGPDATSALLGLDDHTAVLFDIRKGGVLRTLKHHNRVRSVDLSEDGRWALTGSEDYTASFWDLSNDRLVSRIKHNDDVQLVKLSNDHSLALSMSKYDKAIIWHTETGQAKGEIPLKGERIKRGAIITSAAFNQDNTQLLTGRQNQTVELWDIEHFTLIKKWKLTAKFAWKPTRGAVIAVAYSSPSEAIAVTSDGYVHSLSLSD